MAYNAYKREPHRVTLNGYHRGGGEGGGTFEGILFDNTLTKREMMRVKIWVKVNQERKTEISSTHTHTHTQ